MATEYKSTEDEAQSFLDSERKYVEDGLRVCYETFLNRLEVHNKLNSSIISENDIVELFGSYKTLYNANSKLFDDLMHLRLDGKEKLRDNLGKYMVDFIPFFRIYTGYIVKKSSAIAHLEKLKESNKKFRQFLKINEKCAGRELKSFLEEPAGRLPQYLQHLAGVYVAFEHEAGKNSEAGRLLLQAIVDIKKVTDEIAVKCRDMKARLLVGSLQKDIFQNKINLLTPHRFCISHASMNMVVSDKNDKKRLKMHKFILCNDILVVGLAGKNFKSGQLVAVYPLIGLRVAKDPKISDELVQFVESNKNDKKYKNGTNYRFALVPQNKNFSPSDNVQQDSNYMGSVIVICSSAKQLDKWIMTIRDTVDEEEHNLTPCNPVDLEKRLRKQKTSKEGQADTIRITDPEKIKEIKEWKHAKATGQLQKTKSTKKRKKISDDGNKSPSVSRSISQSASYSMSNGSVSSKPPNKPPPRRQTLNAHKRQQSGPLPPVKAINEITPVSPSSSPPPKKMAPTPPNASKLKSIKKNPAANSRSKSAVLSKPISAVPSKPQTAVPSKPQRPPPVPKDVTNKSPPKQPTKPQKKPPKMPVPMPQKKVKQQSAAKRTPPSTNHLTIAEDKPVSKPPEPPKNTQSSIPKPNGAKHRKQGSRMNMLASISSFKANSLKHVSAEDLAKQAAEKPENVKGLLASTLKNYRQFVMDDESGSDESDVDWDD